MQKFKFTLTHLQNCNFGATTTNKYGIFQVTAPLFIDPRAPKSNPKGSKKFLPDISVIPYQLDLVFQHQEMESFKSETRVGQFPFSLNKQLGEFAMLSQNQVVRRDGDYMSSNLNLEFYFRVIDTNTFDGIQDTKVTIYQQVNNENSNQCKIIIFKLITLLTSQDGTFAIDALRPGYYQFHFLRQGFLQDRNHITPLWHDLMSELPLYYLSPKISAHSSTKKSTSPPPIPTTALTKEKIQFQLLWDSQIDLDMFLIFSINNKLTCFISYAQRICGGAVHKYDGDGKNHNLQLISIETITITNYIVVVAPHYGQEGSESEFQNVKTNARLLVNVSGYDSAIVELRNPTGKKVEMQEGDDQGLTQQQQQQQQQQKQEQKQGDKESNYSGDTWLALCMQGAKGVNSITPLNIMVDEVPNDPDAYCKKKLT